MSRCFLILFLLTAAGMACRAQAHDGEHGVSLLPCDVAAGEACYSAIIDDFHANPSTTNSVGQVFLTLNSARTELAYLILLDDLLGLKSIPAERTAPDDILGMHLHLHVPDTIGPHVLNIFGLATPSLYGEEDADLVVDYEHHTLSGIYDLSDATVDPNTGQPYPPFFFATTKVIGDWLDDLERGELVLAVHTVESGFANFAIHGHIQRIVPEPSTGLLIALGLLLAGSARHTASRITTRRRSVRFRPLVA